MRNLTTHIKKPIKVVTNTHYFDPNKTRVVNTFINPKTFYHRQQKIEGYENRLYWEWKYCNEHDGQTFFYTLTYNDNAIPKYMGENCFDYKDLRELLNGAFTKKLLRNYGTKVKYFVGAELGEGKGSRGIENNPHYHILFFLRDAKNKDYRYKKISKEEFRTLIREYWQGVDQGDEYYDYRKFKKGIAKEGDNGGLVNAFNACIYVAKYVCKDVALVKREEKIRTTLTLQLKKEIPSRAMTYQKFWDDIIVPKYNVHIKKKGNYKWNDSELWQKIKPHGLHIKGEEGEYVYKWAEAIIEHKGMQEMFKQYCEKLIEEEIRLKINEYRNRYCNKCRISQGVGDYALKHIEDKMNPKILIDTTKGTKVRDINLFYYRKLYCDVIKDAKGQNIYIMNELGKQYKKEQLHKKIEQMYYDTISNLDVINQKTYEDIRNSPINTDCFLLWPEVKNFLSNENNDKRKEIIKRYCIYKLVYEGRFFKMEVNGLPKIDVDTDFAYFIERSYKLADYRDANDYRSIQTYCEGYLPYNAHPYFLQDMCFYTLFDTLADYLFIKKDDKNEKEAKERSELRKYHRNLKIKKWINENFK